MQVVNWSTSGVGILMFVIFDGFCMAIEFAAIGYR
jgi:hypothetical protein